MSGPPTHLVGPVIGAANVLVSHVEAGDLVLTLGAGAVTTVGPQLLELLGEAE